MKEECLALDLIVSPEYKGLTIYDNPAFTAEVDSYLDFMCNPDNIGNCESCPENGGFASFNNPRPCGQQRCWVKVHCKEV